MEKPINNNDLLEYKILEHVEESPELNNRIAASKLGCSVKLAHKILKGLVTRGSLHIKKHNSRHWEYFLTPSGLKDKAKLAYEFLDFSMYFFHEARKKSSKVCKDILLEKKKTVAIIGTGELAEIAYLGIKEWNLEIVKVYGEGKFMGMKADGFDSFSADSADAILICLYDKKNPTNQFQLPDNIEKSENMYWIF